MTIMLRIDKYCTRQSAATALHYKTLLSLTTTTINDGNDDDDTTTTTTVDKYLHYRLLLFFPLSFSISNENTKGVVVAIQCAPHVDDNDDDDDDDDYESVLSNSDVEYNK